MARALFVYWHVAPGNAAPAAAAVQALQQRLRQQHPGLLACLYRRADAAAERVTLMETYALGNGGGVDAALQATIDAAAVSALQAWCEGPRHVEAFDALDPLPPLPPLPPQPPLPQPRHA